VGKEIQKNIIPDVERFSGEEIYSYASQFTPLLDGACHGAWVKKPTMSFYLLIKYCSFCF